MNIYISCQFATYVLVWWCLNLCCRGDKNGEVFAVSIFFFFNAFLSIFTVCLLRPPNLYSPFPPTKTGQRKRIKKKEEEEEAKRSKGVVIQCLTSTTSHLLLTVKRQSTNLAIAPSMFIHKRAMWANPLPTTRTRACACACAN